MKRFEYKVFRLEPLTGESDLEAQLNGLGDLGWELVWADLPMAAILMARERAPES